MMNMLQAGGVPAMTDGRRNADADNPRGYYELERAKALSSGDIGWVDEARGKAVKVIATLLVDLPATNRYRVVFMRRRMEEILASQRTMLINRGEDPDSVPAAEMARLYVSHLERVESWLETQPHISKLDVDYNELMTGAARRYAQQVSDFLGGSLDVAAMTAIVEPDLYRQRSHP